MAQEKIYNCPRCQNLVSANSSQCPKCGTRLIKSAAASGEIVLAEKVIESETGFNNSSFGLSSLLLTITLIAVCLALFASAPGLGIMMAVLALPAFIRTLLVIQRKNRLGNPVSGGAKIGLYLGSFGVTLIVTVVTLFASALTFCLSCMGGLVVSDRVGNTGSEQVVMLIAFGFTIAVAGLLLWAFSYWIRYRWRRDAGQE